ncbi:MAG TPA: ASKHA domain-containing protein [Methanoregulaceae archaeon]|nr:MAG: DUF4445 domain-containing protein [Methanolinea sp.]HON81768.1 ASKHA domain-containing protein [Methanoregulaceae archaeon]HPD10576.1 ASKHA domain-containing protein [Methanoregulaceae archaeon]HRT15575.1 ASKHA domain-containing protein [Methanoregulaceae archaeon]HRU31147.1 ASKHA domain-containing protein [Methanoregulaceae archaeon]
MPAVTFLPGFRKTEVRSGSSILKAAQQAGIHMNVVCGGLGKCGKCTVYVKSGRYDFDRGKYGKFFTEEELEAGACLACQTFLSEDVLVFIPEESIVQEQKILIDVMGTATELNPAVWKYALHLSPPSLDDPSPDLTRLLWGIERAGGPKEGVIYAPLEVIRRIPRVLRESGWKVTATVVLVPGGYRLIDIERGDTTPACYGAAVDLGTTTIVVYLRNLIDGSIMGIASAYNRQISCGEDILSRVTYARKEGLKKLQSLAAESINSAITEAANNAGVDRDHIYEVVVAGNTIMTHILMGIDPAYMIEEPYVPVVRRYLTAAAGRAGLEVGENSGLFIFPAVSDFIGGDIIADILASGMAEREDISLLIDIGTNFEVVLGNRDWMFACAGAAGPALEGGEVLFGMRANAGAIEQISLDLETLTPAYRTIMHTRPKGLCGSGLIDLLAELLRACVIDRTGRINTAIAHGRIRSGRQVPEFVVAWKEETGIGKDIVITENDIKALIMSKASVLAACLTLMNQAGITRNDIARIHFSGAFGNYISKENAITIGLIPEVPVEHISPIGNGAIEGANLVLLNRRKKKFLDEIARKIAYIELNAEPSFMDEYTGSCFLPHTDLSLFPMVEEMLEKCRLRRGAP